MGLIILVLCLLSLLLFLPAVILVAGSVWLMWRLGKGSVPWVFRFALCILILWLWHERIHDFVWTHFPRPPNDTFTSWREYIDYNISFAWAMNAVVMPVAYLLGLLSKFDKTPDYACH